jgi:hypothetical protein
MKSFNSNINILRFENTRKQIIEWKEKMCQRNLNFIKTLLFCNCENRQKMVFYVEMREFMLSHYLNSSNSFVHICSCEFNVPTLRALKFYQENV